LSLHALLRDLLRPDPRAARRGRGAEPAQEPSAGLPPGAGSVETVANEIALLRRSLQALSGRLREIGEKLLAPDAKAGAQPNDPQSRLARHMDLLSRTEQRAEVLRKQLLELIEKETALRTRLAQMDEEMRPESIDRSLTLVGTTRTAELRDVRRRILDNERKGVESLFNQTAYSRLRLEEDVKQADALVARIRLRLLPLIEKEIDKINPEERQ
jgi:hypothetical protein